MQVGPPYMTAAVSPFTNPMIVVVNPWFAEPNSLFWLSAATVSAAGPTVTLPAA